MMNWIIEVYIGKNLTKKFNLDISEVKIGRAKGNHINLPAEVVSRNHAILSPASNYVVLEDLQSTNGTYYKDKKIDRIYLKEGDFFIIGPYGFKLIKSFFEEGTPVSKVNASIGGQESKTETIDKEVKEKIMQQMNGLEDTWISSTKGEEKF